MENQANFLILVHKVGMCSFLVYLWALKEILCLLFLEKVSKIIFLGSSFFKHGTFN